MKLKCSKVNSKKEILFLKMQQILQINYATGWCDSQVLSKIIFLCGYEYSLLSLEVKFQKDMKPHASRLQPIFSYQNSKWDCVVWRGKGRSTGGQRGKESLSHICCYMIFTSSEASGVGHCRRQDIWLDGPWVWSTLAILKCSGEWDMGKFHWTASTQKQN